MSLAEQAMKPFLPIFNNEKKEIPIFCHTATWLWAAEEATELGRIEDKAPFDRVQNIVGLPGGPQTKMLNLQTTGTWDFSRGMPPPDFVMCWLAAPFDAKGHRGLQPRMH